MYIVKKIKVSCARFINNSYVIISDNLEACLVDPAWEFEKIVNFLRENNLNLKFILLTHSHYDHINLANKIALLFNIKVYMSRREILFSNFKCHNLKGLSDYDKIYLENLEITCILTPGHSPGSMCFKLEDNLFTGDTLFIEGCGLCDTEGGSIKDMFRSIKKITSIVNENTRIFPGHSFKFEPGYEYKYVKNKNVYLQIDSETTFIKVKSRFDNKKYAFNFKN